MLLEGFDPRAHLEQPIDALPVYKSNEPGQLDRAGIGYKLFDPSDDGIPGSFGILYTNGQFVDDHPTRRAGLRAGVAEGHGGRHRRPGRRGRRQPRADPGRRQQELPVGGGRELPLAGGEGPRRAGQGRPAHRRHRPGPAAGRGRRLHRGRRLRHGPLDRRHLQRRAGRRGLRPRRPSDLPSARAARDAALLAPRDASTWRSRRVSTNGRRSAPWWQEGGSRRRAAYASRTRRVCSMSCFSCVTRASTPSNLRSLRRNSAKRTSARSP